jgi:Tudor domain
VLNGNVAKMSANRNRVASYVEEQSHRKAVMLSPLEYEASKQGESSRPLSPAPSLQSITLSEFLASQLPTSTPLPSEIDVQSEIEGNAVSVLTSFNSDDSIDDLEKTIRQYEKTPLIVQSFNLFMLPLVRIDKEELFGEVEEVCDADDEGEQEDEEVVSEYGKDSLGYQENWQERTHENEESGVLESQKEESEGLESEEEQETLKYQGLHNITSNASQETILENVGSRVSSGSFVSGQEEATTDQSSDESLNYSELDDDSDFDDFHLLRMPPLVRISTEILHVSMSESEGEEIRSVEDGDDVDTAEEEEKREDRTLEDNNIDEEGAGNNDFGEEDAVNYEDVGCDDDSDEDSPIPPFNPRESKLVDEPRGLLNYQPETSLENLSCPEDYAEDGFPCPKEEPKELPQSIIAYSKYHMEKVDTVLKLRGFPPVIRDPTAKLRAQVISNDSPLNIFLAEIFSPVHFWFHFEFGVTDVMDKLAIDYDDLPQRCLSINDEAIVPGLLVACYLKDFRKWHRAMVINPLDAKGTVRLFFVDYGTVGVCHKTEIKFLFEKYLKFPRYANRGRLLNLKPPGGELAWTEPQVSKFIVKWSNKELQGRILSHDEDANVYTLDINRVKNPKKIVNLRTWVAGEGIAVEFEVAPDDIFPMCYHFPTFDVLEKNYPTFHEKSMANEKGTNFDLLVETNFLANIKDSQLMKMPGLLRMVGQEKYKKVKSYYYSKLV